MDSDDETHQLLTQDDFVPRKFWGPTMPGYPPRILPPVPYVFVGYVRKNYLGPYSKQSPGTNPNQFECTKEMSYIFYGDLRNKMPDIRFNFMFCGGKKPVIYEGRGWTRQPALPTKYRELSNRAWYIGIIGDYSKEDVSVETFEAIDVLLKYAVQNNYLSKTFTKVDLANPFKVKPPEKTPSNYISSIYK